MKPQASHPIDQAHIIDLKCDGLITPALIARLPPDPRQRLMQVPDPDTH